MLAALRSRVVKTEVEDPCEELRRHEHRHYVLNDPVISAAAFDRLMNRLKGIKPAYTNLTRLGRLSPTPR